PYHPLPRADASPFSYPTREYNRLAPHCPSSPISLRAAPLRIFRTREILLTAQHAANEAGALSTAHAILGQSQTGPTFWPPPSGTARYFRACSHRRQSLQRQLERPPPKRTPRRRRAPFWASRRLALLSVSLVRRGDVRSRRPWPGGRRVACARPR